MVKKASTGRNGSFHPNRGRPQCKTDPPGFRPRSKQDSSLSAMAPSQSKLRIHRGQAAAPRWEPPHLFGGGALQRSEKAPYLKLRFSAGHFDTRGLRVRIASEFKPPSQSQNPIQLLPCTDDQPNIAAPWQILSRFLGGLFRITACLRNWAAGEWVWFTRLRTPRCTASWR